MAYDGQPKFDPIEDTGLDYAVNTDYSVIKADGRYYLCHEGVWYESESAQGPWTVSIDVPQTIYTIPPSCPVYNVRYVYVYDHTPEVVRVGYLPGYLGSYVYGPTVVFGTGYRYPAWYGAYYYPRPVTFGFHARYNPFTGSWGFGFGFGVGGGYYNPVIPGGGWLAPGFGAGFVAGAAVGSAWGRHHGGWWGPGGYHGSRNVNVNIGQVNIDRRKYNYNRYGNNIYRRSDKIRPSQLPAGQRLGPGLKPGPGQRPGPGQKPGPGKRPARIKDNNVFTDRQGNVYRRTDKGWQKHGQSGWSSVKPSDIKGRPGAGPGKPGSGPVRPESPKVQRPVAKPQPGQGKPTPPKVQRPVTKPQPGPGKPTPPKVQKPVAKPQPGPGKPTPPKVQKPVTKPQPGQGKPNPA